MDRGNNSSTIDAIIGAVILFFGLFVFLTFSRIEIVSNDSAQYVGLAKALVARGGYEFNFRPHTRFSPGMPIILALVQGLTSAGYPSYILTDIAFAILALVAAYLLLREVGHAYIGCVAVLLLASSPDFYQRAVMTVGADFPFLFFSLVSLICVHRVEASRSSENWIFRSIALFIFVVGTVMIRAVGVSLLLSLLIWIVLERIRRTSTTKVRVWSAVPAVLGGSFFYGMWTWWVSLNSAPTWPGEFMHSYRAQLILKDVHRPELGFATAADFASRIATNSISLGAHFAELLTHSPWIEQKVYSPIVAISVFLVLAGFVRSARTRVGMMELYFVSYGAIFLLWPFQEGPRYLFPLFPIALLYAWRGGLWCVEHTRQNSSEFRISIAIGAGFLFLASAVANIRLLPNMGVQGVFASFFWLSSCLLFSAANSWRRCIQQKLNFQSVQPVAISLLVIIVVSGVFQEGALATKLRRQDPSVFLHWPLMEVSRALQPHLQMGDSIMAAHEATVHYITGFRCIEFPVIRDAAVIKEIMEQYNVRYLIVNLDEGSHPYFVPAQKERYLNLLQAFPDLGSVIYQQESYIIVKIGSSSS